MEAVFFASSADLRKWLRRNHTSVPELLVGLHKKGSGKPSVTWPELVDQLLCFGWIDGVRRTIDGQSYSIRITPRRRGSNWSLVNLKRARELIEMGWMEPAGLAGYEARDEEKSQRYSYERGSREVGKREESTLGEAYETRLRANPKAWAFFQSQAPYYQKLATWWVVSAKREETRRKRLETLIRDSANGERIGPMRRAAREG